MKGIVFSILLIGILSLSACGALTTAPAQELELSFADIEIEIVDNKVVWAGVQNWEDELPPVFPTVWVCFIGSDIRIVDNEMVYFGERNWGGESYVISYAQYLELDIQDDPPRWFEQFIEFGLLREGAKFIPGETDTEWSYIPGLDMKLIEWFESFEDEYTKLPDGTYMRTHFLLILGEDYPELYTLLTEFGKEALRLRLNEALEAMEPYKTNEIPPFKYTVSEAKLAGVDDKHLTLLFGEEVVSNGH